jgi:hypothetical protein
VAVLKLRPVLFIDTGDIFEAACMLLDLSSAVTEADPNVLAFRVLAQSTFSHRHRKHLRYEDVRKERTSGGTAQPLDRLWSGHGDTQFHNFVLQWIKSKCSPSKTGMAGYPLVVVGAAGASKPGLSTRPSSSCSSADKLIAFLSQHLVVVSSSEFRTSQRCPLCGHVLDALIPRFHRSKVCSNKACTGSLGTITRAAPQAPVARFEVDRDQIAARTLAADDDPRAGQQVPADADAAQAPLALGALVETAATVLGARGDQDPLAHRQASAGAALGAPAQPGAAVLGALAGLDPLAHPRASAGAPSLLKIPTSSVSVTDLVAGEATRRGLPLPKRSVPETARPISAEPVPLAVHRDLVAAVGIAAIWTSEFLGIPRPKHYQIRTARGDVGSGAAVKPRTAPARPEEAPARQRGAASARQPGAGAAPARQAAPAQALDDRPEREAVTTRFGRSAKMLSKLH